MADMTSYVGIHPRTVIPSAVAIARGTRVVRASTGLVDVAGATAALRGDYVTITSCAASEPVQVASMDGGGKVPALAEAALTGGTTAIGATAYGAANGLFSNISTSAAVLGKWTTVTTNSTLGEVELISPIA